MPDSGQREKMMPFVGKYVQATGAVFERKGTRAIAITQIKELKNVHLHTTSVDSAPNRETRTVCRVRRAEVANKRRPRRSMALSSNGPADTSSKIVPQR